MTVQVAVDLFMTNLKRHNDGGRDSEDVNVKDSNPLYQDVEAAYAEGSGSEKRT